ncbi:MAG: class I SAM-dependent methyltransferase [Planctomycetota bacterium]
MNATAVGTIPLPSGSEDSVDKDAPPVLDRSERHFLHRGVGPEFAMEVRWIMRQLRQSAGIVADIGCGNGVLISTNLQRRMIGVESNTAWIQNPNHASSPILGAKAEHLPFADNALGAAVMQHVIEHFADPIRVLRECRRVLKPDGYLLIVTPNAMFPDERVFEDETHRHIFRHDELGTVLKVAGFEVKEMRTLGLNWFTDRRKFPAGWRFRRIITDRAEVFSRIPLLRWRGQALCALAHKPVRPA